MKVTHLNLLAPINQLGYGVASMNILKQLVNTGVKVALFPIGGVNHIQVTNREDLEIVKASLREAKRFYKYAPSLRIWHQNDLAEHVGHGPHIGMPIFELDTFTEEEKHHISSCDKIFVCSHWAKNVVVDQVPKIKGGFGNEGFRPYESSLDSSDHVSVTPLGVDQSVFTPTNPTVKEKVVFFNCGKWEVRKGHDILVEAFKIAHSRCRKMELHMMCSNPFNTPEEEARWRNLYNHEAIRIIPRAETQTEVYKHMANADCGIFPSRAEGWNLELLEMMSIGRHTIATNYSAHTEFCNQNNCTLIPVTNLEDAYDEKWFFGSGKWAKLDQESIELIANTMVQFAKSYDFSISMAGIETAKRFSWENTASRIIESI